MSRWFYLRGMELEIQVSSDRSDRGWDVNPRLEWFNNISLTKYPGPRSLEPYGFQKYCKIIEWREISKALGGEFVD